MSKTATVFVVILEEHDDPVPFGDGKLINREILAVHRSYESAKEVYDSHREFWADKSRFSVFFQTEQVKAELAREVPA